MIRRPPRSTLDRSSAASDVYKRQVLKGTLQVKTETEIIDVEAGSAILTKKDEWIQYSTPFESGAEYVAICLPAFSPDTVHRDE